MKYELKTMASILFLLCEIFRKICFFSSITQKSVFSLNQSSEPYRSYRSEPYRYRGRSLTAGPHFFTYHMDEMRVFPHSSVGKESAHNEGDLGSIPALGRSPQRRERLPTPVFWPGEFHGLYNSWDHKEWDMTEQLSLSLFIQMKSALTIDPLFVTAWTVACQAPLSMEFSRQQYWSGLPFPPPGDLSDLRIEASSPALAGKLFPV